MKDEIREAAWNDGFAEGQASRNTIIAELRAQVEALQDFKRQYDELNKSRLLEDEHALGLLRTVIREGLKPLEADEALTAESFETTRWLRLLDSRAASLAMTVADQLDVYRFGEDEKGTER